MVLFVLISVKGEMLLDLFVAKVKAEGCAELVDFNFGHIINIQLVMERY
jgi:hypothetical protein